MMPVDLRARHVELLAAMASDELQTLALAHGGRLAMLLEAIADASRELCVDLAPPALKPGALSMSPAATDPACQVVDLASRRRAAGG
ncbi:MAG: hypothetical protein J0I54_01545 [Bosea sp.]|uniref:hypothetical protein n=1 Tax=unclassified Bosea (in: a-proteobacteria) TaxID=2653178 RepID=UPI0009632CBB|nr:MULTISPECIES: hypothetical protein [unclassified Bosea (in: a-proteobacteria)]MBN9455288.1 hypothetical protein [Bosea sp. (in: a-proteobacteria)]OJV04913.1 MAG: hypothetical protein BGO20_17335 [Bosea sp. 67-29]